MFDEINLEKEEKCDECGYETTLANAVYRGKMMKLCSRCLNNTGAIRIKKPAEVKVEDVKRRTVSEVLTSMSGVKPKPLNVPNEKITLENLRARYEDIKRGRQAEKEARLRAEPTLDQERTRIEQRYKKEQEKKAQAQQPTQPQTPQQPELESPKPQGEQVEGDNISFNLETAKHTRIRDLLTRMRRRSQEVQAEPEPEPEKEEEKKEAEVGEQEGNDKI